jgi:anti-anti-sigma factor
MEMSHRIENGVCFIQFNGNFVISTASEIKKYVEVFSNDSNIQAIILNCARVNVLDSTGIGLIASILKSLKNRDAQLRISNLTQRNLDILKMIEFDRKVPLVETEEEALSSLK